jgi:HK97 family phage prohead protease
MESKVTNFDYDFKDSKEPGTFEGYGSVFGNVDDYGDMISKGAFTSTLAEHRAAKTMPKMLLNHGGLANFMGPSPEDLIPVGKWTDVSEDDHGLHMRGQLINLDTESGKRLYGAMREKTLDGLSIGYRVKDFKRGTKESEPRRTIKAVHLIEVSPVTFPANSAALINSVKSALGDLDIRSLERVLRDAGLSRTEAKALLAGGFKAIPPRDAVDADQAALEALSALAKAIRSNT